MTPRLPRMQPIPAPLASEARYAQRLLLASCLLLVLATGLLLAYGLSQTAELTSRQVGQLQANLLAEGEAERLHLTYETGMTAANRASIEKTLALIAEERPEIQSLTVLAPDGQIIARYPAAAQPAPLSARQRDGWHRASSTIETADGASSVLNVTVYRGQETDLTFHRILAAFSAFIALWALSCWLLLRQFCRTFIERPSQRLRAMRSGAATAHDHREPGGIWQQEIAAEQAKQEKLDKLLHALQWHADEVRRVLPSRSPEVAAVLGAVQDLQPATRRPGA